ncbi:MAG TPA: dihydrofolate reductase [Afifellaceae bacterium]|nr:dihydrofolate reductase [Afifellaceae bacterium]
MTLPIVLVVAVAENGVIGLGGKLPWKVKADLRLFRRVTIGKPVIMGRRTYDSIGKALDGRANIVVTRNRELALEGVEAAYSLSEAVRLAEAAARRLGAGEICVIGGSEIFFETLPRAERLHFTHVAASPEGDTYFPPLDKEEWLEVHREPLPRADGDTADAVYVIYNRRH